MCSIEHTQTKRRNCPNATCPSASSQCVSKCQRPTDYTDQPDEELVKTGRSFPYRQSHAFEIKLEEYPWNPFAVLKRSRIVGDSVLEVSSAIIMELTCEVMSLRRLASMYVVGTTRRKY
jgi:hypothetical protein